MRFRSRISGRELAAPPVPMVPDLFEVQARPDVQVTRVVPGGVEGLEELPFLGRWPEAIDLHALAQLTTPLLDGAPWMTWVETLPLVPQLDEKAQLHPLEREAIKLLAHLQYVCHRPRLHLRVDEERLPVSQARRTPARAAATLVSHPEDWEHRTLRGIRPARILATRAEDEWNLYENRVAVRLVDNLLGWVGRRRDELNRIKSMAEEGKDFRDETRGSRWRGGRLYARWGRFFSDDVMMGELERTFRLVERLERDLQALLDSPLYQRIPRNQSVPGALRPTNILVSDPHYRKVAALWRAWAQHGSETHLTREEIRRRRQAACHHFGTFAQLLVVRALHELGYRAPPDALLTRSSVIELSSPWGNARLCCSEDALTLELQNSALRLVPLLAPLRPDWASALWNQLREHSGNAKDTVVLAFGRPQELDGVDEETARALLGWARPRAQPISPWSLDAVERVARMLRNWEAPHRLTGYPPRAVVRPDPGVTLPKWMKRHGETIVILSPTDAAERRHFSKECAHKRGELEREEQQANKARRGFDIGRLRALDKLETLVDQVERLELWTQCPVCEAGRGIFEPRPASSENWGQWSWWCRCTQCSSEWGLRVCGSSTCRLAYPVLEPAGCRRPLSANEPPPIGWMDSHYGRDLWAEPCWSSESIHAFRCSHCGSCSERGCSRCSG